MKDFKIFKFMSCIQGNVEFLNDDDEIVTIKNEDLHGWYRIMELSSLRYAAKVPFTVYKIDRTGPILKYNALFHCEVER